MTFALLQSRARVARTCLIASTRKTDLNYSARDCFPEADPRAVIPALESIGEQLYQARAKYMLETDQGLTKTYNALKETDPRILDLRQLHEELDRAVLAAYGWQDIESPPLPPGRLPSGRRRRPRPHGIRRRSHRPLLRPQRGASERRSPCRPRQQGGYEDHRERHDSGLRRKARRSKLPRIDDDPNR